MADEKKIDVLKENLTALMSPEGVQKYILGTKKNGTPRAIYDVVKDYTHPKKKNKKHKKHDSDELPASYSFYLGTTKKNKKKKKKNKKKKKDEHWHI
jgi:hypothetical protein